jgi:NitT/TauT family transport system permease protein
VTSRKVRDEKRLARGDMFIRIAFVVFLLALWQGTHYYLVVKTESWSGALFRSPFEVAAWLWNGFGLSYFTGDYQPLPGDPAPTSFWEAFRGSSYPPAIMGSLRRLMVGYFIAIAIGFPLGLAVAHWRLVDKTIGWMAVSLQSLPSICWIPLAQLWMGRFGEWPILFVTIMGALFATIVSVADGIRQVSPLVARAGRTLGADGPRLYFGVLLPAALPGVVTGLKIAWSFAWRSLMAAELIVNTISLGNLLDIDRSHGDMEGVISTIIIIIIIGLGTQSLVFAPIERRLRAMWGLTPI